MSVSVQTAGTINNSRLAKVLDYFSFRRVPGQLPELDGLRGIAVLLVLLRHAIRPYWPAEQPVASIFGWDVGVFMSNGWIGVDLFFILSGFLITHHILRLNERRAGNWAWSPYLEKRALRIVPAYFAVLFVTALGLFPYYEFSQEYLGVRVGYHMLFLQDYLPANIVVAFWSLGVEEKFYLLAPFLILASVNKPTFTERVRGIVLLMLLGIVVRMFTAFNNPGIDDYEAFFPVFRSPFHMTLDPLLLGVLVAFVYKDRVELPRLTSQPVASIVFWAGAFLFLWLSLSASMMQHISWWDKTLQPTAIALAFAAITFGLLFGGGPAVLFRSVVLFFFARISYSLYLVHLPLVPVSILLAKELSAGRGEFLLFALIFGGLSTGAALFLHFAVEKPFLLVKDRVGQRS